MNDEQSKQQFDFFFQDLVVGSDPENPEGLSIQLRDLIRQGQEVEISFFTSQLNRLLVEHSELVAHEGTSHPPFNDLLNCLDRGTIGKILISARTDINENVNATLDARLYFINGTVLVEPHWCAYKSTRTDEIAVGLLKPLIQHELLQYTFINENNAHTKIGQDRIEAMKTLIRLSGYGHTYDDDELNKFALLT